MLFAGQNKSLSHVKKKLMLYLDSECMWVFVCRRVLTLQQERGSVCHSSCAVMRRLTRTSHPMTEKWPFPPSLFLFSLIRSSLAQWGVYLMPLWLKLFLIMLNTVSLDQTPHLAITGPPLTPIREGPHTYAHTHANEYRHRSANEGTRMLIVEIHKCWQIRLV